MNCAKHNAVVGQTVIEMLHNFREIKADWESITRDPNPDQIKFDELVWKGVAILDAAIASPTSDLSQMIAKIDLFLADDGGDCSAINPRTEPLLKSLRMDLVRCIGQVPDPGEYRLLFFRVPHPLDKFWELATEEFSDAMSAIEALGSDFEDADLDAAGDRVTQAIQAVLALPARSIGDTFFKIDVAFGSDRDMTQLRNDCDFNAIYNEGLDFINEAVTHGRVVRAAQSS